jgi:hypothetical protein
VSAAQKEGGGVFQVSEEEGWEQRQAHAQTREEHVSESNLRNSGDKRGGSLKVQQQAYAQAHKQHKTCDTDTT